MSYIDISVLHGNFVTPVESKQTVAKGVACMISARERGYRYAHSRNYFSSYHRTLDSLRSVPKPNCEREDFENSLVHLDAPVLPK